MRAILEDYDVLPLRKIKENQCSKNRTSERASRKLNSIVKMKCDTTLQT